jgi:ribosome-associated protein
MIEITPQIRIPEGELSWQFVRSGGPGGQNVNKVASKAVLRWDLAASPSLSEVVKARVRSRNRRRINKEGVLVLSCQAYRDQDRNRQECVEKLRSLIQQASVIPKKRRPTKPTRGSKEARLRTKKRRAAVKSQRRELGEW